MFTEKKKHPTLGLLLPAAPPTQSCLNNTFLHIFNKFVFAVLKKRKDFQNQCKVGVLGSSICSIPIFTHCKYCIVSMNTFDLLMRGQKNRDGKIYNLYP